MKMMFNGLDQTFELLNSRYEREAQEVLCFAKYHSPTLYIYICLVQVAGRLGVVSSSLLVNH
jgi:hypothetical protein